jgi:hypothetical protein
MRFVVLIASMIPLMAGEQPDSLGIYFEFAHKPNARTIKQLQQEVRSHLPSNVDVRWRALRDNQGSESFDQLVVIRFKGECVARPTHNEWAPIRPVLRLAATPVAEGKVLPYSEVDCDQVRRSLGQRVADVGRALGVVVAHELKHILENTVHHAKTGIMRQRINWDEVHD